MAPEPAKDSRAILRARRRDEGRYVYRLPSLVSNSLKAPASLAERCAFAEAEGGRRRNGVHQGTPALAVKRAVAHREAPVVVLRRDLLGHKLEPSFVAYLHRSAFQYHIEARHDITASGDG